MPKTVPSLDDVSDNDDDEETKPPSKTSKPKSKTPPSFFLIGDTHFRKRYIKEAISFVNACVAQVAQCKPDFIVCLGDTLDEHDYAHVLAYNVAVDFFKRLSQIAPTYVLIGNHDVINSSQYLSTDHFFNPLKHFTSDYPITIVDDVQIGTFDDYSFLFIPYVPKDRFIETIDASGIDMTTITAVFSHIEINGVNLKNKVSDTIDEWPKDYPPLFSGHIHEEQIIGPGKNVYYTGSSMQLNSDDSVKKVWNVTLKRNSSKPDIQKFDLGIKTKKTIYIDATDFETFDSSKYDKFTIELCIRGTTTDFKVMRKTKKWKSLKDIKYKFKPITSKDSSLTENLKLTKKESTNYFAILKKIVGDADDEYVKKAYELITD